MKRAKQRLPQLGALELAVLEYLWTADEADVLQVHGSLGSERGITANTVGSAVERLYRKKLVTRRKVSHAYRYRAALSRDAFTAQRMLDVTGEMHTLSASGLLAAFIDLVADEDESSLDRLEALIAAKRSEREGQQ